jgi:uncharacterized protein
MANIFEFNTHELPRRAGEMKEYQFDLILNEDMGVPLIAVHAGDVIEVDARLESVTEGILLSADIYAVAKGECIRCLDPVEIVIDRKIQDLYRYEPTSDNRKEKKEKKRKRSDKTAPDNDVDLESDDELWMDGNIMNLEVPIRDAIVLDLPVNPLCSEECEGLCPDCGEKWATLDEGHLHEAIDARWAGLSGLDFKNPPE